MDTFRVDQARDAITMLIVFIWPQRSHVRIIHSYIVCCHPVIYIRIQWYTGIYHYTISPLASSRGTMASMQLKASWQRSHERANGSSETKTTLMITRLRRERPSCNLPTFQELSTVCLTKNGCGWICCCLLWLFAFLPILRNSGAVSTYLFYPLSPLHCSCICVLPHRWGC